MTKGVLFDLDGTLADTARDFFEILNNALKQANITRKSPFSYDEFRPLAGQGADAMVCYSYEIDKSHEHFAQYKEQFLAEYKRQAGAYAILFPGISELLAELEKQQIPWAIVTDKPCDFTLKLLKQWELKPSAIVCSDDREIGEQFRKPHPKSLEVACTRMDPSNSMEWVYIGDSVKDIQAGHAAQMRTIAVTYGYTVESTLLKMQPKAHSFVNSPKDLSDFLMQWLSASNQVEIQQQPLPSASAATILDSSKIQTPGQNSFFPTQAPLVLDPSSEEKNCNYSARSPKSHI
jgi:HAD superfamily hydrolase (TIGR01549 family)